MSDYAIQVENLSKRYRIGAAQERADNLREALASLVRGRQRASGAATEFWALRDVSFEVERGEVIGVIGRNGAGKSTLLKILSRITEPTEGRAVLHGRVGSLLEVGTGFHPELTGRENVYLSGAILGMRRAEIDRQFDEIVAFSEIEKFLDTPVKRYSSGMYVRLAFAVAAHLNPEILLVDEVLAVGDAQFQKKCLGKMGDVAKEGRTVLFVSHNMAAIQSLCSRVAWLTQGEVAGVGSTDKTIRQYAASLFPAMAHDLSSGVNREGNGRMRFVGLRARNAVGEPVVSPSCGDDITFELRFESGGVSTGNMVSFSLAFFTLLGQPLFLCRSDIQGTDYGGLPKTGSVFCRVPRLPLPPGTFRVNLHCEVNGQVADWVRDALQIEVQVGDYYGSGRLPDIRRGDLLVEHQWLPVSSRASERGH